MELEEDIVPAVPAKSTSQTTTPTKATIKKADSKKQPQTENIVERIPTKSSSSTSIDNPTTPTKAVPIPTATTTTTTVEVEIFSKSL